MSGMGSEIPFKTYEQHRGQLFPAFLGEALDAAAPAFFIDEVVEGVDLSAFERRYAVRGMHAYAPRMLLKLWLYATTQGLYSGRELARKIPRDLGPRQRRLHSVRKRHSAEQSAQPECIIVARLDSRATSTPAPVQPVAALRRDPIRENREMKKVLSATTLVACLFTSMTACSEEISRLELDPKAIEKLFQEQDRYSLWINLINEISKNRKIRVAEIGVWKGEFAQKVLEKCPNIERYYLVDPWRHLDDWKKPLNVSDDLFERAFQTTLNSLEFAKDRIAVLRGTTLEVIDQIEDGELDLVYIDGDHTAKGIVIDLLKLSGKVKTGGVIGGDDYVDNIYHHDPRRFDPTMVKPVVNGFVAAQDVKYFFSNSTQFAFIN